MIVVSPSNFHSDRSMIMCSDIRNAFLLISYKPLPNSEVIDNEIGVPSVLIIDAICVWSI